MRLDLAVCREEPLTNETKTIDMPLWPTGVPGGAGEVLPRGACSEESDVHQDTGTKSRKSGGS